MALQKRNSNEKKRIWGFEDIQADTNTQQQGAEVDTDTMQNSSSSQKKTINTQKRKEKAQNRQHFLFFLLDSRDNTEEEPKAQNTAH